MSQITLSELQRQNQAQVAPAPMPTERQNVSISMDTVGGFELLQRAASLFANSSLVPDQFRRNMPNCAIAMNMALRMKADPLFVMQSMYIVHGKPSWSSSFLIAMFNNAGRYSGIKYRFKGKPNTDEFGCQAYATDLSTEEEIAGPYVTLGMAKAEGWTTKAGSKWKTMPDLMLRYRAAAFMIRTVAPEIAMGIYTSEEMHDVYDVTEVAQPNARQGSQARERVSAIPEAVEAQDEAVSTQTPDAYQRNDGDQGASGEPEHLPDDAAQAQTQKSGVTDAGSQAGNDSVEEPPLDFRIDTFCQDYNVQRRVFDEVAKKYGDDSGKGYVAGALFYLEHPEQIMPTYSQMMENDMVS